MNHEDSVEQATTQPTLCVQCNDFFSNSATGLCSKCHREHEASSAKTAAAEAAVEALVRGSPALGRPASAASSALPQEAQASTAPADDGASSPEKNKPSRCQQCRKKVGLTGFKCKCGQVSLPRPSLCLSLPWTSRQLSASSSPFLSKIAK